MVKLNNPLEELKERLLMRKEQYSKIKQFVSEGTITQRLGDYIGQLMVLDHLAEESEVYAQLRDFDRAVDSLTKMELQLDSVAAVLMSGGQLEIEVIGGLKTVKNPCVENIDRFRGLYDFAQQKCEQAKIRCEQLMEAVI